MRFKIMLLLFLCITVFAGCGATTELNISTSEVSSIIIQSGTTGENFEVSDVDTIRLITDSFNSLSIKRSEKTCTTGCSYGLIWYGKDGKILESIAYAISPNENYTVTGIKKDGYDWKITNGEVDNALIESLLP